MTAKILDFPKFSNATDLSISDRQTIDAVEILIEYMAEVGCDLDTIVNSKELGDVIHRIHILIQKANGVDFTKIDWEKSIDIQSLYKDNGYLKDPLD
jgi:hypothetical protein